MEYMKFILIFLCSLSIVLKCQTITSADFLYQATLTNYRLWNNFVGVTFQYDDIQNYLNSSIFQGYIINSNTYGNWFNNWVVQIRIPQGYHQKCSDIKLNSTYVQCKKQLSGNETFYQSIADFIKNTTFQPYWTFGTSNQYVDWSNQEFRSNVFNQIVQIYEKTGELYFIEPMYQADKAVQNNLRDGNYTVQDMLSEIYYWQRSAFGIYWKGPGISQQADSEWLLSYFNFSSMLYYGFFTAQAVIFPDSSLCTIQNLMSDNYTKQYLVRRFSVDGQQIFTSFSSSYFSFSNIKLTEGDGIDGVTNTFASAVWLIDFTLESSKYQIFDLCIDSDMYQNNRQGFLGPGPDFEPQPFYYAMIFISMLLNEQPTVVLPQIFAGTSENIKIWGLKSSLIMKFLILNKDTNNNLNGTVKISVKSTETERMKCIYLEAPSLNSPASDIRIAGHKYQTGNQTLIGNYQKKYLKYDLSSQAFQVPLKYAQVALCEVANIQNIAPTIEQCYSNNIIKVLLVSIIMLGMIV